MGIELKSFFVSAAFKHATNTLAILLSLITIHFATKQQLLILIIYKTLKAKQQQQNPSTDSVEVTS